MDEIRFTLEGGSDHRGTFCDVPIDGDLFIIGGYKKHHCKFGWR
jgi:hypothetical protein